MFEYIGVYYTLHCKTHYCDRCSPVNNSGHSYQVCQWKTAPSCKTVWPSMLEKQRATTDDWATKIQATELGSSSACIRIL